MSDYAKRPAKRQEWGNPCGFTPAEQSVMNRLVEAWDAFVKLDSEHPDETRTFRDAMNSMQDLLGMRVLRRSYPDGWATYGITDTPRATP
jgi:hypothetical protein